MNRPALIFDLDGVLIDVSHSYRLAIQYTAEFFLKTEIKAEEIQQFKDRGGFNDDWKLTRAIILAQGKDVDQDAVTAAFQSFYRGKRYSGLIRNERWLLKAVTLEKLKKRFSTAIVTGRPHQEAVYALERFRMNRFFDVLITRDDVRPGRLKPDPEGILLALDHLNTRRGFGFGDTIDDIRAFRSAGLIPVAILANGPEPEKKKMKFFGSGAWQVLEHIEKIEEVLDEKSCFEP